VVETKNFSLVIVIKHNTIQHKIRHIFFTLNFLAEK